MAKIFQIVSGMCHWQTPFKSLDETVGKFPPDCIFVEAPDCVHESWGYDENAEGDARFIRPECPEGFLYDEETGTFYPASYEATRLENEQKSKQMENTNALSTFLSNHPLSYTDGKQYGVTMEDQTEINLNISQYQIQKAAAEANPTAGITPVLEWHSVHEACVAWTIEDLSALVMAISAYVYPWFQLMNKYKEQIYACTDVKAVKAITIEYKTDEEKAAEKAESDTITSTASTDNTTTTDTSSTTTTETTTNS